MNTKFLAVIFLGMLTSCGSSLHKKMESADFDLIITKYADTIDKNDPEINYQVAEAFRQSNRIQEAEPFYEHAVEEGVIEQDAYYYYAKALKANQK